MDKEIVPVNDYNKIKKYYGEEFAKLCRSLFPTILEHPGLLWHTISRKVAPNSTLAKDFSVPSARGQFQSFIMNASGIEAVPLAPSNGKTPKQLMKEKGYILYPECQTEEDIQAFKKFYKQGEEICTFRGKRLETCRVWFAVKEEVKRNINAIPHSKNPKREDKYGTSVISIQFTRGNHSQLSIKNRYNHNVDNPDATFGNNLEAIVPGLTNAFIETYGLNYEYDKEFEIDDYYLIDGKLFKPLMYSTGEMITAEGNYVLTATTAKQYDPDRYIIFDKFILDTQEKTLKNVFGEEYSGHAFIESVGKISKVDITYDEKKNKVITIQPEKGKPVVITLNKQSQIIKYKNENVTELGDGFLDESEYLEEIELPNVKTIGREFLYTNSLKELYLPNVEKISDYALGYSPLRKFDAPKLKTIGDSFLNSNRNLEEVNLPALEQCGKYFLQNNIKLKSLNLPNLVDVDDGFLYSNKYLESISAPKLKTCAKDFLFCNNALTTLYLPSLVSCGASFLCIDALVAGGVPDYRKGQAPALGILQSRDDRWYVMCSRDEVYRGCTKVLQGQHEVGKLLFCDGHPFPACLADLVVLAVPAMQRAAAEEDHSRALLPCHGWLLPTMQPHPGDPDLGCLGATSHLTACAVNTASVGAEFTQAVRR